MDDSVTFDIEDEEGKKRREVCDYTIKKVMFVYFVPLLILEA